MTTLPFVAILGFCRWSDFADGFSCSAEELASGPSPFASGVRDSLVVHFATLDEANAALEAHLNARNEE